MIEEWRPIAGYQDYEVSNLGRVRSWRIRGNTTKPVTTPRLLKFAMCGSKRKYRAVKLYRNNVGKSHRVHRLVLEAFVGPMPEGLECRHINGKSIDNRLSNLCYGTHLENMDDQKKHGTGVHPSGEKHGMSKLTESDILTIRSKYAAKELNQYELAEEYGIHQTNVSLIVRGLHWRLTS